MNHSDTSSYQTFRVDDNLNPTPEPQQPQQQPASPPDADPPQPGTSVAAAPNIIYVQHYFGSSRNNPTHETAWSNSMFGCCSDMHTCFVTAACPCVTAGRIAEIVNEGRTSCQEGAIMYALFSVLCMHSLYTCQTRTKMRKQHMLRGNDCDDCVSHTFCTACALCQEYRELYRLGLDPGIGWHENVERQRHAVAVFKITPPLVEEGMMR